MEPKDMSNEDLVKSIAADEERINKLKTELASREKETVEAALNEAIAKVQKINPNFDLGDLLSHITRISTEQATKRMQERHKAMTDSLRDQIGKPPQVK